MLKFLEAPQIVMQNMQGGGGPGGFWVAKYWVVDYLIYDVINELFLGEISLLSILI